MSKDRFATVDQHKVKTVKPLRTYGVIEAKLSELRMEISRIEKQLALRLHFIEHCSQSRRFMDVQ